MSGHVEAAGERIPEQPNVKDHVYKLIELTGTSTTSIEDAVDKAIERAHKTLKQLCWFQLVETRGNINKGAIMAYTVYSQVLKGAASGAGA